MQKLMLSAILFLLTLSGTAQEKTLDDLRSDYLKALHDYEKAPEVYDLFLEVQNPSAKILAYRGALEAIMTKTTWNLFKKMNYLNKSEQSFNNAVKKSPNDVEIRFMRMAVQYEIPEYLGYSEDMEKDRKFIVQNINDFDTAAISAGTLTEILGFMKRCNRFTDDQIEKFKGILALK